MRRPAHTSLSYAVSWLMRRAGVAPSASTAAGFLFGLSCLLVLTACGLTSQQRILYDVGRNSSRDHHRLVNECTCLASGEEQAPCRPHSARDSLAPRFAGSIGVERDDRWVVQSPSAEAGVHRS